MLRIAMLASDKPRERLLADAFLTGAKKHGHEVEMFPLGQDPEPGAWEVVAMVGVKSRERWQEHLRAGAHTVMLDKGYSRHKSRSAKAGWEYWRFAIDAHHPTARLAELQMSRDRMKTFGWKPEGWRKVTPDGAVILAGSSLKYHDFYGLSHPTTYARQIVGEIVKYTSRPVIYRPKPSWREATPIRNAAFSQLPELLSDLLATAHVLVTHGSNACFEAIMAGVPCVVLGDGVAKPIASADIAEVNTPRIPTDAERSQWLANLAYHQWTLAEFANGEAWDFIGGELHAY